MKKAELVARLALGFIFALSGVNYFLEFLPKPEGFKALVFFKLLESSGYLAVVKVLELVGGIMLLANRFVPLALVILGPIVVNILLFHIFFAKDSLAIALVLVALEVFLISRNKRYFILLFKP